MATHPVFLRLDGRRCVVVGGGPPAMAKALACARAGAAVTLLAPALDAAGAGALAAAGVRHVPRGYAEGDLAGAVLCYAATDDPALVARLRAEATRERVLLNVVDRPDACDFYAAAMVERGALTIAVGSDGTSPAVTALVRRRVEESIGPEYADLAALLGALRRALADRPDRGALLRALLDTPLLERLRVADTAGVDRLLAATIDESWTLARLESELAGRR